MENYKRKTKDVYTLWGNYGYGWDALTYEDSYEEAMDQRKIYLENEPKVLFRITKHRKKTTAASTNESEQK